jgi:CRISPR system Cascade subunit CasC
MNLVEVHLIQSVPPANLNRDDTGSPKDALFGGVRRARISSQSQKRAVRQFFSGLPLLRPEERAVRTRLLVHELVRRFPERPAEETRAVVIAALRSLGLEVEEEKDRTQYLLFLGQREIDRIAQKLHEHWDDLRSLVSPMQDTEEKATTKQRKQSFAKAAPKAISDALAAVLDGGRAVDIALFGRMLADRPEWGKDAACQVAHAISTHRVDREFDFYTAVDELQPREASGAGMMGDVEYYTATFYRYADINLGLLLDNLEGDADLASRAVEAFLRAFVLTLPSGKQNTFAAHSLPQFVAFLVRRDSMPRNLAAAFERPVFPRDDKSLSGASVEALMDYWQRLDEAYGRPSQEWVAIVNLSDGHHPYHADKVKGSLEDALQVAMEGVRELLGVT